MAFACMSMLEPEKALKLRAEKTTIHEFEITRIALPEINFRVVCSKGTYIRSLAFLVKPCNPVLI
jgi:tRNA U55 pseudouridine synthase TruB